MSEKKNTVVVFADSDNGGIIHVANIKGGVGKSTVATNLAAALSRRGPTLIIDLDVQGSATHALGKNPTDFSSSSWQMFHQRFSAQQLPGAHFPSSSRGPAGRLGNLVQRWESTLVPLIVGKGEVTSLAVRIQPCLDLIPANSDLFKTVNGWHIRNFLFNLQLCRCYYKYIVLDTPSIWNHLARTLFMHSDLNLVPVTLNALSTKSLRDYLLNIRQLAQRHRSVRIRIVKNEVFGRQSSAVKGKIRTMNENRRFLEGLCEQVVIHHNGGTTLLPQSILLDLEIPESATVRDAQDEGKSVLDFHQYAQVAKAFESLAKSVQYVLNNPLRAPSATLWNRVRHTVPAAARVAACLLFMAVLTHNRPVRHAAAPRPIAPQQLVEIPDAVVEHTFVKGESLFKMAKYAICHFRAVVPSVADVNAYAAEVADVHNQTRLPGETTIASLNDIPAGLTVRFYPPSSIVNAREKQLVPVYRYFNSISADPHAYITGDWCERGTGGGSPHYGLDVAAAYGSNVITPVGGTVYLRNSATAGRTIGIVNNNTVIFFSHLDKRYFKDGDTVVKGAVIGTVGMTGRTSGPHIHIGYGIKAPRLDGVPFGGAYYKLTDPKLFFYREHFLQDLQ